MRDCHTPFADALEFVEVGADGKAHMTLTYDFVNRMARVAVVAFLHSLSHLTGYLGWTRDAMRSYEDKVTDVLKQYAGPA